MPTGIRAVTELDGLPAEELTFRFASGRLCLAFCATVGERWRRAFERLRTPEDLSRWLVAAGLSAAPVPVSRGVLRDARELREAVYRLVRSAMAGVDGSEDDRALVNAWARRPPIARQIGLDGDAQLWTGRAAGGAGLATVALDAVDLLTSSAIGRVRECAAPDCALLFFDTSRPGRRRWCADRACGAKARSASYRARRSTVAA